MDIIKYLKKYSAITIWITFVKIFSKSTIIKKKATHYFLKKESKNVYYLDKEKIAEDEKFDGFLAIATNNTDLSIPKILDQYKQLYKIEQTFRTFKSHLDTKPMFH